MGDPTGDRMIRIDMSNQTASVEAFPEAWKLLGGRALSARILLEECDPTCDALGPDNVLVFAPGVLAGTSAPTSGRLSVGAQSPLTGGSKEANTGGNPGQHLTKLGYRCLIVTGQPADPEARFGVDIHSFPSPLSLCDSGQRQSRLRTRQEHEKAGRDTDDGRHDSGNRGTGRSADADRHGHPDRQH